MPLEAASARAPAVSVVAPTYRRKAGLPAFVEPLLAQPDVAELIIAVDGSDDGSVEWLEGRARSDARLRVLDRENSGAGPTRQAGIEAATRDVVLLLDDDVIASPGLVSGHARHHAELASKLVMGYMPNDWRAVPRDHQAVAYIYRGAYELHCAGFRRDPSFVLQGFWGGNVSMPREDFLRVGIQGLEIARGQDDREFGIRCARAGIEPVFDSSLQALHLYDRDLAAFRRDMRLQGESRRMLRDAHADFLGRDLSDDREGETVADAVGMNLPAPLRRVWPWVARDPLFGVATAGLWGAIRLARASGHLGFEVTATRALGSLETMRGVLDRS